MDQKLKDAAEQGNIDELYSLIEIDTEVLNKIDEISFVQTPLHVAAAAGKTEFAMEIMMLRPSFARKLNPNGFTPLLLAVHNNQNLLVCELLHVHKDLVCAKGRGGMNPLHYAAQTGNLDLLAQFLYVCPKSIEDVTSRSETALHVALKYDMFDAFQLLVTWFQRAWFKNAVFWWKRILNWKDVEGNTVLHIAASKNQLQVVTWLLGCGALLDVNVMNSEGFTVLDIVDRQTQVDNQEMRNMLCHAGAKSSSSLPKFSFAGYFRSTLTINEKLFVYFFRGKMQMSNDMRNMLLVVSILLVTIAYQAVLSPPGGFWQDNSIPETTAATNPTNKVNQVPHLVGRVTMSRKSFYLFLPLNTLTFCIPLFLIVLVLPPSLPSGLLSISFALLFLSYVVSVEIIAPLSGNLLPYFFFFSSFLLNSIASYCFTTWKRERILWAFSDPEKVF